MIEKQKRLTLRRERFAQLVASGMSQADAYRQVFSTENFTQLSIHQVASRLARNVNVRSRIDELREQQRQAAQLTPELVVAKLLRNADLAISGDHRPQYAASNQALELLGRIADVPGLRRSDGGGPAVSVNVMVTDGGARDIRLQTYSDAQLRSLALALEAGQSMSETVSLPQAQAIAGTDAEPEPEPEPLGPRRRRRTREGGTPMGPPAESRD